MVKHLIQSSVNMLPLIIEKILWDGDVLLLAGVDWSFNTVSAWRIINDECILFACWDKEIDEGLNALVKLSIIAVWPQGRHIQVDPVFELSNGTQLEVFSTDTVEPWVWQLPDGKVYIGGT